MTKKLCIIGESQAVMFKLLLDARPEVYNGWHVDFFCRPGTSLAAVKIENSQLVSIRRSANTERETTDLDEVDLLNYDVVLLVGFHVPTSTIFSCITEYTHVANGYVSDDFLNEYIAEQFSAFPYYSLAKEIAHLRKGKTYFFPSPFFVDLDTHGFVPRNPQIGDEDRNEIWQRLESFVMRDQMTLLRQPHETVSNGFCTKPELGALNRSNKPDHAHCSKDFAELILNLMLEDFAA